MLREWWGHGCLLMLRVGNEIAVKQSESRTARLSLSGRVPRRETAVAYVTLCLKRDSKKSDQQPPR